MSDHSDMVPSPRDRMVVFGRSAHPRARRAFDRHLRRPGAQRRAAAGSAYHYFPGGRTQLLCEAIDFASESHRAAKSRSGDSQCGRPRRTRGRTYRKQLHREPDFRAGCPDRRGEPSRRRPDKPDAATPVIERAAAAFLRRWTGLIAAQLIADGVSKQARAAELCRC